MRPDSKISREALIVATEPAVGIEDKLSLSSALWHIDIPRAYMLWVVGKLGAGSGNERSAVDADPRLADGCEAQYRVGWRWLIECHRFVVEGDPLVGVDKLQWDVAVNVEVVPVPCRSNCGIALHPAPLGRVIAMVGQLDDALIEAGIVNLDIGEHGVVFRHPELQVSRRYLEFELRPYGKGRCDY